MNAIAKHRAVTVFFGFACVYLLIAINLFFLQILNASFFTNQAKQQHSVVVTKHGPRAPIIDRTGTALAVNKDITSAFITPHNLKDPDGLTQFLCDQFPAAFERLATKRHTKFMYLKRHLTEAELTSIKNAHLPDIHLMQEQSRFYPVEAAGPIIGITNIDNNGLFGIELQEHATLTGTPAIYYLEKDARSGYFYFNREERDPGAPGKAVQLSIDGTLQFLVDQALQKTLERFNAQEAAAIIMDPATGQILAMANYPRYNPNDTRALELDSTKNKALTESYELGSVIKVFTALAALQEGVVTPDELIDCKNCTTTRLDGRTVNTWKAQGVIPFTEVIASSNNIGIATVAKRLDNKLYDHFLRMGFGKKTGIVFAGQASGFVNPPSKWSKQSIISLSYGYEITATLLQLACAFALIANDGKPITPTLSLIHNKPGEVCYDAHHIAAIKEILRHTTQHGTSYRSAIKGYEVMCKTGTTNLLIDGAYQPDRHAFTCAGIIKKGEYQRVIVTFVKNAEQKRLYASQVAAPLFEQIAQKTVIHEHII